MILVFPPREGVNTWLIRKSAAQVPGVRPVGCGREKGERGA